MYSLIYLKNAQKQIARLDRSVAERIKRKLAWLVNNIDHIEPEWLHSSLSGLAKLREGDFRIVYEIRHDPDQVVIYAVAHRSDIYRRR